MYGRLEPVNTWALARLRGTCIHTYCPSESDMSRSFMHANRQTLRFAIVKQRLTANFSVNPAFRTPITACDWCYLLRNMQIYEVFTEHESVIHNPWLEANVNQRNENSRMAQHWPSIQKTSTTVDFASFRMCLRHHSSLYKVKTNTTTWY